MTLATGGKPRRLVSSRKMWPLTRDGLASTSVRRPVGQRGRRWSGRRRTVRPVRCRCASGAPPLDEVCFLRGLQLGLLAAQPAVGLGDLHALPRPHSDEVFSDHPEDVELSRLTGSVGSWSGPPMFSLTPASVSSPTTLRASPRERASRSSLVTTRVAPARHVASARAGGPGPGSVGAGQAVGDVDPVRLHPETGQRLALGGEVLGVGRGAGVPDEHPGHPMAVAVRPPLPGTIAGGSSGNRAGRSYGIAVPSATCGRVSRRPFLDRFAYSVVVRRGQGWLSPSPAATHQQLGPVSPGWRVRPDDDRAPDRRGPGRDERRLVLPVLPRGRTGRNGGDGPADTPRYAGTRRLHSHVSQHFSLRASQ